MADKSKKAGRNLDKCKRYKGRGTRETNKLRKLEAAMIREPAFVNDAVAMRAFIKAYDTAANYMIEGARKKRLRELAHTFEAHIKALADVADAAAAA